MTRPPAAAAQAHPGARAAPTGSCPETRPDVRDAFRQGPGLRHRRTGRRGVRLRPGDTGGLPYVQVPRLSLVAATGPQHCGSASSGERCPTSPTPMSPSRCRTCSGQSSGTTGTCSMICRCLGAKVIEQWARRTYGVRLMMMVIPHTFGRHLNFNCHLHVLVSEGGLKDDGSGWRKRAPLNHKALMPMWRYAVITYLREAYRMGVLKTDLTGPGSWPTLLRQQYERWWNIHIQRFQSRRQFLGYAGRYARRPPIAQHRFRRH